MFKHICNIFNDKKSKMKLQSDRMDSELLLYSLFGSKEGEKVRCYTMDDYEKIKERVELSLFSWRELINDMKSILKRHNNALPIDTNSLVEKFNLGVIECVSYNNGQFKTKTIDLKDIEQSLH